MADFCKQCADDLGFATDFKSDEKGNYAVLCEGCGHTIVDQDGVCQHIDCGKPIIEPEKLRVWCGDCADYVSVLLDKSVYQIKCSICKQTVAIR